VQGGPAHRPGRCPRTPWVLVCVTECLLLLGLGLGQANARIELLKQPCHFESFLSFEQLSPLLFWGPGHGGEDIRELPVESPRVAGWPLQAKRVTFLFKACGLCSSAVWGGLGAHSESPHCGLVSLPVLPPAWPSSAGCCCVRGATMAPGLTRSLRLTHPSADGGAGFTCPPLSSGSPARWREQCWGDGEPLREDHRGCGCLTYWLTSLRHPPGSGSCPTLCQPRSRAVIGLGDQDRVSLQVGLEPGKGGHTPGQKEPNSSEAPPSPSCLAPVTL